MVAETDQEWWQRTWTEREGLLDSVYGKSHPPQAPRAGTVLPLSPELREAYPACCVNVYRPDAATERPDWFYVSHGPTQPAKPWKKKTGVFARLTGSDKKPERSGTGFEFGILVKDPGEGSWPALLLQTILHYSRMAKLDRGHRIACSFVKTKEAPVFAMMCSREEIVPEEDGALVGDMSRLLLWPTMDPWHPLHTSTGLFEILVATAITEDEWVLAKETSSQHLLLLLFVCGVGQRTDPFRKSVLSEPATQLAWREIKGLSSDDAFDVLYGRFAKGPPPGEWNPPG